jgi:Rha family phage regulatory protein
MYNLSIINREGRKYVDSREVAALVGKRHDHLLRDIAGYLKILEKSNAPKVGGVDFFSESRYQDAKGETRPCYLISKMGCEMVANKLFGEKGVLFTALYVAKFNEMETSETVQRSPRLSEFNSASRLIVRAMHDADASPGQIVEFLRKVYEPLGIAVQTENLIGKGRNPRLFSSWQIAKMLGVMSLAGKPHYMAILEVINRINPDAGHKVVVPVQYGKNTCVSIRYDSFVVYDVKLWFEELGWPAEIASGNRVYRIIYTD